MIEDFPKMITGKAATPTAKHQLEIRGNGTLLSQRDTDAFHHHHSITELLSIGGRACRDLHAGISFLTMRVKGPGNDDWSKLKRLFKYTNGTRRLKSRLKINSLHNTIHPLWYMNGLQCIHWDNKGHGGVLPTLGERGHVDLDKSSQDKHKEFDGD